MRTNSGFFGVYPMVYALFDAQGRVERKAMKRQVEAMVAHGAHGVAVLGLASEVNKLSGRERRTLMEWVAEDLAGRLPLAVTVAEPNVEGQVEFTGAAADLGAGWVILQPPPVKGVPETEFLRFFGAVAERSPVPVAIQIAPEYLGVDLSHAGLRSLNRNHPNVALLKVEASAVAIHRLLEETDGAFDVFNGRAGVEITDALRAGCVGVIPGAECVDVLVRIFDTLRKGTAEGEAEAERLYHDVAPLLVFLEESIDTLLVYGKLLLARRLGLDNGAVRPPSTPPTSFGVAIVDRHADRLGTL